MKDFKSFNPEDNDNNNGSFNPDSVPQEAIDMVKNMAKKYHGKTEGEMMDAIFEEANKNRKNGTLSDKDLDNFVSMVSPLIDEQKRAKLNKVINKLKNND